MKTGLWPGKTGKPRFDRGKARGSLRLPPANKRALDNELARKEVPSCQWAHNFSHGSS